MAQYLIDYFSFAYSLFPMVILGCYGFRKLDPFHKLFLLQGLCCMGNYAIVAVDPQADNQWLFNIYIALEYTILIAAAATVITKRSERIWLLAGFTFFAVAFISNLISKGPHQLANYAIGAGAIPILVIYLTIIYRSSQNKSTYPMVWVSFGLVLYFCGIAPLMTLWIYLMENYTDLHSILQFYILEVLGHFRYLLAAVSFWLYLRHRRSSNTQNTLWPKEI